MPAVEQRQLPVAVGELASTLAPSALHELALAKLGVVLVADVAAAAPNFFHGLALQIEPRQSGLCALRLDECLHDLLLRDAGALARRCREVVDEFLLAHVPARIHERHTQNRQVARGCFVPRDDERDGAVVARRRRLILREQLPSTRELQLPRLLCVSRPLRASHRHKGRGRRQRFPSARAAGVGRSRRCRRRRRHRALGWQEVCH
mmetsp:Transcript_70706/g.196662  ORF Transcript_70706/g.196662 Transcript_70706/m.196662 type:complete len:206 (+) Transcript_70706:395-1012(+)